MAGGLEMLDLPHGYTAMRDRIRKGKLGSVSVWHPAGGEGEGEVAAEVLGWWKSNGAELQPDMAHTGAKATNPSIQCQIDFELVNRMTEIIHCLQGI